MKRFSVKEIVFLAIVSAVALVTSAVMPLVASLQTVIFGIAQLVTGIQISLFFAIGLMKVRKTGALFIMALFTGIIQLMMASPMFFSNLIIGLLLELFAAKVLGGYESERNIFITVMLYNPLSLPFNVLYNYLFGREAMVAVATKAPLITIGMTLAIIAVSALGAWLGIKVYKELEKAGAIKK